MPDKLADDEELNNEKLNALKTAIDDLKIVDVERKPAGLSRDLRVTDEFVNNNDAAQSLATRGFYPVPRDGRREIYSSDGEAICTTKDGVRYVLRFGNLAGSGPAAKGEDDKDGEKKADPALNRYLFVMAEFDESQIPKPEFEPLPGEQPAAADKSEANPGEKSDDKPAAAKEAGAAPAAAPETPAKPAADADKPAAAAKPAVKGKSAPKAAPAKVPQKKTAAVETNDEPAAGPKAKAEPAASETDDTVDLGDEPKADQPEAAAKPEPTPEEERRIAIERENKRKQDEYDSKVKKGQDKVKELNDRFADWYFIIPDDVYKKIHLGRGDVVRKKEAPADDKAKAGDAGAAAAETQLISMTRFGRFGGFL